MRGDLETCARCLHEELEDLAPLVEVEEDAFACGAENEDAVDIGSDRVADRPHRVHLGAARRRTGDVA